MSSTESIMTLITELSLTERQKLVKDIWALNKSERPTYTDEEKAERKRAAIAKSVATRAEKRAAAIADGTITPKTTPVELSAHDKAERKRLANEKRKATWAKKRADKNSNSPPSSPPRPRGRPKKITISNSTTSSDSDQGNPGSP